MEGAGEMVISKLEELGPAVSVDFNISIESYFDVLTALVDKFAGKQGLSIIYISVSVPASTIVSALTSLEIDISKMRFVDCISFATMECGEREQGSQIIYVESPTMLEYVVLKMEYLFRKNGGSKFMVIVDSVNSFAAHNDVRQLYEFMQVLIANMRSHESYPVLLSIEEQLKPEVREMLGLVCDQIINVK